VKVLREIIVQLCAQRAFSPRIAQETGDNITILGLCAARQGIAIVPSELSRVDIPDIHFAPLVDDDAATDIYLTYRDADPKVASLCRIAEAAVAQGQAAAARAGGTPEARQRWPRVAGS
jgi:DNA-binding transcriptional LysR family regulator